MSSKEHKPQPIGHKIRKAIAGIPHCTARISRHIIFNMMHPHVMSMVTLSQMAKKGANAPK